MTWTDTHSLLQQWLLHLVFRLGVTKPSLSHLWIIRTRSAVSTHDSFQICRWCNNAYRIKAQIHAHVIGHGDSYSFTSTSAINQNLDPDPRYSISLKSCFSKEVVQVLCHSHKSDIFHSKSDSSYSPRPQNEVVKSFLASFDGFPEENNGFLLTA